jgi:hypothetical protein
MKSMFAGIVRLVSGLALALCGLALVDFLLHPLAKDAIFHSTLFRVVVMLALVPLTLLAGFLIIRRVPGNIVGPLLLVWSGTVAYWSLRAEIGPGLLALFAYYDIAFGWPGLFLMVLHFPDGQIYPPGAARWTYRLLGTFFAMTNLIFLSWATLAVPAGMANPFHLPALAPYAEQINGLGLLLGSPILVLALVSPVLRFRKGSPRERLQIKWLALFAGASITYVILGLVVYPLFTGGETMNPGTDISAMIFYLTTGLFPPLAIGLAVLRHRLWDIDLIIRRTLVYSILTVCLTLVYFGSVVVLQQLFTTATGRQSPAAIVLSTLAIAALFTPFRRRIQTFIDRRFYRRKYNAERVLATFGSTLREKVDLDQLTNSIQGVVEETMQPAHLSLWLRRGDRLAEGWKSEEDPPSMRLE